ncbi:SdpA family antimicrobial peptide system protein [Thermicanus aegyptius]|uniref:SdpA family antimicrobial peptide system protein n=1 Tax=Thermicanus aegyptius TaxID=94009 RepID=UPI0006942BDE|nr:SdpA family antimicrobial peptide system protein [Thermicanus aegyptius]
MERRPNLFLFVVVISAGLLVFLLSALQLTLPNNPTRVLKNMTISKIFPQGWGFYSISPREEQIILYDENGNLAVDWPNASLSNLFGLLRKGRAQGLEVGIVSAELQENDFTQTEGNLKEAIKSYHGRIITVKNPTPNAMISGKYFVVKYQIVPWTWARLIKQEDAPAKIVEVNVVD